MIIAIVDKMVTPTTVNTSLSSDLSSFGRIAAIAKAADAPQIATAPAERKAKRPRKPKNREAANPNPIVNGTINTTIATIGQPSSLIIPKLIRSPNNATPNRNNVFDVYEIPGPQLGSSTRKFRLIPNKSASNMDGAP